MASATFDPQTTAGAHPSLTIYNTLSKKKEPFETVEQGKVGIYLCGPTVYGKAHIGHMVGPVLFDTIKRHLTYSGYRVQWVVNITDVDDKLIKAANDQGITMAEVAALNTKDYEDNLAALGVTGIDDFPKATECMGDIIAFIEGLVTEGFAYASQGDVYFDVARDNGYGKLSNRTVEGMQGDGGGAADRKRSAADFALWKSAKEGEPSWESPWGNGRPGWHIECSAMSKKLLGETFDIHGGGLDLVFPHHENEIAQSECCHGKPMAKYWAHNGLLRAAKLAFSVSVPESAQSAVTKAIDIALSGDTWEVQSGSGVSVSLSHKTAIDRLELRNGALSVDINLRSEGELTRKSVLIALGLDELAESDNESGARGKIGGRSERQDDDGAGGKMSRSKGAGGLADLIERQGGERIRFFLLRTHYRSTVIFSEPAIEEAAIGLETFYRLFKRYARITGDDFYALETTAKRGVDSPIPGDSALASAAEAAKKKFVAAMDDDFNTGAAIAELFELAKLTNKFCEEQKLEESASDDEKATLVALMTQIKELASILGVFQESPASAGGDDGLLAKVMPVVIALRADARAAKNFAVADAIRDGLAPTGITLEDRAGGTEWEGGSAEATDSVMKMLIDVRASARAAKDFATGDAVRDKLSEIGVTLEDHAGGTEWTA